VDWGNVPAWIAAVAAAFSVAMAFLSWRSSRTSKTAKDDAETRAEEAKSAAQKAANAETRSAAAAERAAKVLEDQHQLTVEQIDAAEGVPWRVEHRSGSKWELWNDSDHPKFGVQISGPGPSRKRIPPQIDRIDGRSAVEFWGTTDYGAEMRVDVSWHRHPDGSDEARTWSGSMPVAARD
jgi:hypothetical protein